ncbi:MAG: secretion protein HlyD [Planctomycetota bacterium]|nr:secretion protein HlyD [Planctomycetota bacterium]
MKRVVLVVVLLLVVVGGSVAITWMVMSRRGDDPARLVLQGNVDVREVNLAFQDAGRIDSLAVDEGDIVHAGQVIATLEPGYFEDAVAQARATLVARQADLARLKNGSRPEEIAQARALTAERSATRANATAEFQRQQELIGRGATSKQAFDNAQASLRQVEAQVKSAEAAQHLTEIGPRLEEIDNAAAQCKQAEAALADAERHLHDAKLLAPGDGVVQTRARERGAYVNVGDTVFSVTLPKPIWVRAYVAEPDLGRIQPGMEADVATDGGKTYRGQVGFISPVAEFTPKSVETKELRTDLVYRLRVVVDAPDGFLRQGMPVTVTLHSDRTNGSDPSRQQVDRGQ